LSFNRGLSLQLGWVRLQVERAEELRREQLLVAREAEARAAKLAAAERTQVCGRHSPSLETRRTL
jgi:hypothetical protein